MIRIEHVKKTIPHLLSIMTPFDELVFVDYGDPEESGLWVKSLNDPRVKVIKVDDVDWWHMNHARNIAVKFCKHEIVFLTDVDTLISKEILQSSRSIVSGKFGVLERTKTYHNNGSCCFTKTDFLRINGFEEALVLWGFDDDLFYTQLQNNGAYRTILGKSYKIIKRNHTRTIPAKNIPKEWGINNKIGKLLLERNHLRSNVGRNWGRGGKVL